MLHTKFRGNRSAGSGEEDFEGFLPYMGMDRNWTNQKANPALKTKTGNK